MELPYATFYKDKLRSLFAVKALSQRELEKLCFALCNYAAFKAEPPADYLSDTGMGFYNIMKTSLKVEDDEPKHRGGQPNNQNARKTNKTNGKNESVKRTRKTNTETNVKTNDENELCTETDTERVVPEKPPKEVSLGTTQDFNNSGRCLPAAGAWPMEACPDCGAQTLHDGERRVCKSCRLIFTPGSAGIIREKLGNIPPDLASLVGSER